MYPPENSPSPIYYDLTHHHARIKKSLLIAAIITAGVLALSSSILLYQKFQNSINQLTNQPINFAYSPSPTPTPNPTQFWKVYTTADFSFKHPPKFEVLRPAKNFYSILEGGVTIDARLKPPFDNFEEASKTVTGENIVLIPAGEGAIVVEKKGNTLDIQTFSLIISSFSTVNQNQTVNWQKLVLKDLNFKTPPNWWYEKTTESFFSINPTPPDSENNTAFSLEVKTEKTLEAAKTEFKRLWGLSAITETQQNHPQIQGVTIEGITKAGKLGTTKVQGAIFEAEGNAYILTDHGEAGNHDSYFHQILSTMFVQEEPQIPTQQRG